MAAVRARALAALLVLVAVGAGLADDEPLMKPARIVSRYEQRKPGAGAIKDFTKQFNVQSFTELPLALGTGWLTPVQPEAGKKQQATLYIINVGDQPVPAGTIVSIWANRTEPAKCGESGDVDYKLPELLPLETKAIKASWKVPDTPGEASLTIFIDSACTVFNQSDSEQQTLGYTVVPTGTKYAFLYRNRGGVDEFWGTFKANVGVINLGTAPSEAGVMMAVYYDNSFNKINTMECTHAGQISVELPTIAPGKTKVVPVEGLKAADDYFTTVAFFIDATCKLAAAPVRAGRWTATTAEKAGALLGGVQTKGQITFTVETSPKKPKANATMMVKVKIANLGDADGPVGRVTIYTSTVASFDPYFFPAFGLRCDLTDFAYSINTDLVIKAGKSKTVKVTDVPVPAQAGWSALVALPDADCTNVAETGLFYQIMPSVTFEAVAP